MGISLFEGPFTYIFMNELSHGPQNVRTDKQICNLQAPQMEIHVVLQAFPLVARQ